MKILTAVVAFSLVIGAQASIPISNLFIVNSQLGSGSGAIHNSTGSSATINYATIGFYDGLSDSGNSCAGNLIGANEHQPINAGQISFNSNQSISLNASSTYVLAQTYAIGGASAVRCIDIQISANNGANSYFTNQLAYPGFSVACSGISQQCPVTGTPTSVNVTQVQ